MAFNSVSGTSSSSVSKGIGGLVSGLETDELVKGMTADIQNKIDKQLQEKQKIEWQQETYRSLTKAMSEFNNKYFSSTSMTNITDPSFFSSYILNNPDISSKYVSLSGSIEKANNVQIDQILRLAEKAKYPHNVDMSKRMTGDLGDIKLLSGSKMTFYLDGITKDITLDDIGNGTDLTEQLNKKLKEAFGTREVDLRQRADSSYVVVQNGEYYKADKNGNYLDNDGPVNVPISETLTKVRPNDLEKQPGAVQVLITPKMDENGNAVKDENGDVINQINFRLTDSSSTFALHTASAATILGAEKGVLQVDAGTKGNKLEIGIGAGLSALSGATLAFLVDGNRTTVKLDKISSINDLASQLGTKLSSVTARVDANGKLVLDGGNKTIAITGAASGVTLLGKKSDGILDSLIGSGSKKVTTKLTDADLVANLSGLELNFTIENADENKEKETKSKTIRLDTVKDLTDLKTQLQKKLDNAFGKDVVKAEVDATSGEISFTSEDKNIKIQNFQADVFSNDTQGIIGINAGTSSKLNLNMSLSEIAGYDNVKEPNNRSLTINGVQIDIEVHDTLSSIMQKVNHSGAGVTMTYSPMNGKVSLESNNTGGVEKITVGSGTSTSPLEKLLFGVSDAKSGTILSSGKNSQAVLTIDDRQMVVERASNNISIDGMNMTLKELYNDGTAGLDPLKFNVTTDTDKVVENIKGFVEAYNAIVKGISDEINTRHDRKYPPLTDAQREEMSDKQIEKWEEKAREGLLYRDTALNGVLSQMRLSLYQSVDGVDGFITDCGISTGDYADNGQLKIDETKLRKVLTENPSMVVDLFTKQSDIDFIAEPTTPADTEDMATRKKESGLMVRFQDILQRAVGTGSVKGTLLQMAGLEGDRTDEDNTLTTKMEDIDKKVKDLKKELASAQERYWSQFTALEKYINQMNQQSSALLGQFGYSQ